MKEVALTLKRAGKIDARERRTDSLVLRTFVDVQFTHQTSVA